MTYRTIEQVEALIGEKLRTYRLHKNLTQATVASKAGISIPVLIRMEQGGRTTLHAFIAVVKALQLEDWFDTLAAVPSVNPLLMVDEQPRQRARRKSSDVG